MTTRCLLLVLSVSLLLGGCGARDPMPTVAYVDLDRIVGTWYSTHHIPYWLEDGKVASGDIYTLRPDGRIDVRFFFRDGGLEQPEEAWNAIARVIPNSGNAYWQVCFLWPIWADYKIVAKADDYSWMAIGHPSRDYFWLLSRRTTLADSVWPELEPLLIQLGYDPSQIVPVPQPRPASDPAPADHMPISR